MRPERGKAWRGVRFEPAGTVRDSLLVSMFYIYIYIYVYIYIYIYMYVCMYVYQVNTAGFDVEPVT